IHGSSTRRGRHRCGHDGQRKCVAHMPTAATTTEDSRSKFGRKLPTRLHDEAKNLYYNIPMFSCRFVCPTSHARRPGRRICSGKPEGLNEQGRSRDHESSDEGDKTAQCRAGAYAYASPPSPLLCRPSGIRKSTALPVPGLKTMK